ncbi:375_t:CDS:10, partial [Paraglomus occultum]
ETTLELVELTAEGSLISIIEQPVFGTIKDMKVLHCNFRDENDPDAMDIASHPPIRGQDVLVFLSDSGKLSFVGYAEDEIVRADANTGKGKALQSSGDITERRNGRFYPLKEIKLSEPGFDHRQLGRLICVDPYSRVIAVAAWQDSFCLSFIKDSSRCNFDPVRETKEHQQEGIIWHMTFLYPDDPDRVALAMVVFNDVKKQSRIVVYQFWAGDGPQGDIIAYGTLTLAEDSPLPLHLIALPNFPECFLMITEKDVCFLNAQQVTVGHVEFYRESLPNTEALMTAVAISSNNERQRSTYLYAGLEDGSLYRIDIESRTSIKFNLLSENELNPIAPAMATFTRATDGKDVIIISGEMSDGAVVTVTPGATGIVVNSEIPNWAPILDFQLVDFQRENNDVVYSCSNRGNKGSICELRRVIGVHVVTQTEPEFDGTNALWSLKYMADDIDDTFLAVSFASSTRLMYLGNGELDDISDISGFNLDVSSLCVSSISAVPGCLVQIHRNGVIITQPILRGTNNSTNRVDGLRWSPPNDEVIEAATVCGSYILVSLSTRNGSLIDTFAVEFDYKTGRIVLNKRDECLLDTQLCFITCFDSSVVTCEPIFIVGTYKPSIKIYCLRPRLELVYEVILNDFSSTGINVPESACIIANEEKAYLLIGLREGTIVHYQFGWSEEDDKPELSHVGTRRIGSLAVKLVSRPSKTAFIVALSDRPWQIDILPHSNIGYTCIALENYEHVQEAAPFKYPDIAEGYMFVANNCLYFLQLVRRKKTKVRKIKLGDTPRRILYDSVSNMFVVACTLESAPFPTSIIRLVDPFSGSINYEHVLSDSDRPQNREAVYSLVGWNLTTERRHLRLICVGSGIYGGNENYGGRVMIFTIIKLEIASNPNQRYEMKKLMEIEVPGAVYVICPMSDRYLLIAAGNTLNLLKLDLEEQSLINVHSMELRWPIVSINVCNTRICIGTQRGSLTFYELKQDKEKFLFLKSERWARLTTNSIMLNENLAIGTDKNGNIFGSLYDQDDPNIEPCLRTIFSFHLAEIIPRLRTGYIGHNMNYVPVASSSDRDEKEEQDVVIGLQSSIENISPETESSDQPGWDAFDDLSTKTQPTTVVGCSLLGSVYLFTRINIEAFNLLSVLQSVLEKWHNTVPLLGNDYHRFRTSISDTSASEPSYIIDGEMVTQFLHLPRHEQHLILASHANLVKAGQTYLNYEKNNSDQMKSFYWSNSPPPAPPQSPIDLTSETVRDMAYGTIFQPWSFEQLEEKADLGEIIVAIEKLLCELNVDIS